MDNIRVIVLTAVILTIVSACSTGNNKITGGWVSPDIYRVTASGSPKQELADKEQRRASAKESAEIAARKIVMDEFVKIRQKNSEEPVFYEAASAILKEFAGVVKGGKIIEESCDDNDSCKIKFQVEKNDLKSDVERCK